MSPGTLARNFHCGKHSDGIECILRAGRFLRIRRNNIYFNRTADGGKLQVMKL